jgi:hypothetical protein
MGLDDWFPGEMQFMSSSWSAGDGNYFIEAVTLNNRGRKLLYKSSAPSAERHQIELECVCFTTRSSQKDPVLQSYMPSATSPFLTLAHPRRMAPWARQTGKPCSVVTATA